MSLIVSAYILEHFEAADQAAHQLLALDPVALPRQMMQRWWMPDRIHDAVPRFWWVDEIDMRQLTYTLPFDNLPGGVWTQGWELDPVPVGSGHPTLQVFVVPQ